MNEEIEQVQQIDSELDNVSQIDSELNNLSQIDSILGEVVVISSNFIYAGNIATSDWTEVDGQYYYTILKTTHTLSNPCLIMFSKLVNSKYEGALVGVSVNANEDVTLEVDERITAKFKLEGEIE